MSQYDYEKREEAFHKERRRQLENERNLQRERDLRKVPATAPVNKDEPLRK